MDINTILKKRNAYALSECVGVELALEISKYDTPVKRDFVKTIDSSDTYCLDKGRLCWCADNVQLQVSFCLHCGNYIVSHTPDAKMYCECESPKEDYHGWTMMSIEYYRKTGKIF